MGVVEAESRVRAIIIYTKCRLCDSVCLVLKGSVSVTLFCPSQVPSTGGTRPRSFPHSSTPVPRGRRSYSPFKRGGQRGKTGSGS